MRTMLSGVPLLRWGVGLGLAQVVSLQLLTWAGLGLTYWTWVSTEGFVAVFAILAARSLRVKTAERPPLTRVFVLIVTMVLISRVIYQTYMFIYINYVDPDWIETVAVFWEAQLRDAGTPVDVIEANIADFRRQWQTGYVFTLGILRYGIPQLILGFIAATLASVFPRR